MSPVEPLVTNLELRDSNPDGSEGAGLAHVAEGMFLLHVRELAASGEPRGGVTVLHDAGDHGGRYLELAQALAESGWMVSLPDLRGHGNSEGDRGHSYGMREVSRDVDSIQDHLAYMDPTSTNVLIGQGLGAMQALAYALEKPDRASAVIAIGPLLSPRFQLPEKKGGLMGLFKKVGPTSPGALGYGAAEVTRDAAGQKSWTDDPLTHEVVSLCAGERFAATAAEIRGRLGELSMPVLVLHGADDAVAPVADSRGLAGGSIEVEVVDGAGHSLLHDGCAAEVRGRILGWLDEKLPR